jgi:hypothetical protein
VTRYVVKLCLKVPFFVVVVVHRPFVCASLDAVVCTYTTVFSPFRECRRVYFNSFLLVRVSGKNRKKIFLRARETKFFFYRNYDSVRFILKKILAFTNHVIKRRKNEIKI